MQNEKNSGESEKTPENEVKIASLEKASVFRKWGGLMPYLMHEVPGVSDFILKKLVADPIPSAQFLKQFLAAFPALPPGLVPSLTTIKTFRRKMGEEADDNPDSRATVLKDLRRNLEAFKTLNFVEEQMMCYQLLKRVVAEAKVAKDQVVAIMNSTGKIPRSFWPALKTFTAAVIAASNLLDKLDDLAIRLGVMPPREKQYLIFSPPKDRPNTAEENEIVRAKLGLTDEDFIEPKLKETRLKLLLYFAKESGYDVDGAMKRINEEKEKEAEGKPEKPA